jgi:hypothetical protein
MVRSLLGDFIQNIQPNNAGTVNVNAGGLSITWTAGNQFTALFNGVPITLNGVPNSIVMVTGPMTATLLNPAAVANGIPYTLVVPTGELFSDAQAYVLPIIVLAWRKLQKALALQGHPRLENTAILTGLPVMTNLDPGAEQYINWMGFFDGTNFQTPATLAGCPTLPPDFISPIYLEERQSCASATPANPNLTKFRPMRPAPDGLRGNRAKGSRNFRFDWREDGVHFPGSILPMDIKTRYAAFLPDIVAAAGGFTATPVPIMRCAEALANYAASLFVTPRGGGLLAPGFDAAGDKALAQITSSQSKLQQRASYSRISWGRRGRGGRGRLSA